MEVLLSPMVQVVLEKVCTDILNRAQVIANFGDEFKQLKEGLETTKDFLDSMNLQSKDDMVKGALSQLREAADEADDVLTDCLIRETYKENKFFLRCCFHDMGFSSRVGKQLVDISSKMEKARNELGKHVQMANSTASDKTHGGKSNADQSGSDREFMSSNYLPSMTYGLEEQITKLKKRMIGDTKGKLNSMAIVGMGGLGKTTIAKKFFHDTEVISHFNKMIWVTVSQNFSEQRIVKRMLEKANLPLPDVSKSDNLFTTLRQGLENQAYLIVMDDVWSSQNLVEFWMALCESLPTKGDKSSCIIITTRSMEVAKTMVHEVSKILEPPKLNPEDSWSLFSACAFPLTDGKCPNKLLEEEGRAIAERCGGLPLAIKTVGSCMAKVGNCLSEWTKTKVKFHCLITEGKTDAVMVCLQLSYDELPTDMKQCMLCLSVYPEDFEIQSDQLIHWWFGEGLIRGKESDSKTELGYENLARLANRCLLEVTERRGYDGRILKFKIHDMVRELITRIAEKEKFCNFSPECTQIKVEDSRWLCLTEDMTAELKKPWKRNSKLRVLLLMSSPSLIDFRMNIVFLESLRVLDLSNSNLSVMSVEDSNTASSGIRVEELFNMITSLKRLACLNLSGILQLLELPSSIKKLLNLQVLVLNGCPKLGTIPAKITYLKRLVVLDIGSCPIKHLPRNLGSLSCLEELSGFRVVSRAKTQGCTLLELQKLAKLKVLRIAICDVDDISEEEKKSLSSLMNLKVLAIDAAEAHNQERPDMIGELDLPPNIEELYLRNYRARKMPNWFSPSRFGKLHYLSIEDCENLESLTNNRNSSWKIEGLYLRLLHMLNDNWDDLKLVFPALRYMDISKCPKLINFPIEDVFIGGVWP